MSETRKDRWQTMRDLGYSDAEIGARFAVSRQTVLHTLGAAGTDRRRGMRLSDTPPPVVTVGSDADKALPTALREWRARHGLTQAEAAKILHVGHVPSYAKWERGLKCGTAALVLDFLKLWETHKNILT